jgi:hypothetical protein
LVGSLQRHGLSSAEIKQVTVVPSPPASALHVFRLKRVDTPILCDVYRDRALPDGGLHRLLSDYELFGALTTGSSTCDCPDPATAAEITMTVYQPVEEK